MIIVSGKEAPSEKKIREPVNRSASNQSEYEPSGYLESQLRTDFVDELFKTLGWDLVNKSKLSRLKREVLVERWNKGLPRLFIQNKWRR